MRPNDSDTFDFFRREFDFFDSSSLNWLKMGLFQREFDLFDFFEKIKLALALDPSPLGGSTPLK